MPARAAFELNPTARDADDLRVRPPRRISGPVPRRWVKLTVTGSSAEWWRALQACRAEGTAPLLIEPLADGSAGELVIPDRDWRRFYQFAVELPGWAERDGTEQISAEPLDDTAAA